MTTSIAFIDRRVANYRDLAAALDPNVEVFFLDEEQDGLEQIAGFLEGRTGIDALHIISHGADGSLLIGDSAVTAASLDTQRDTLGRIGAALTADADILLYGCNVASGPVGTAFVNAIAVATGADVAASSDRTGATILDGDSALEVHVGNVNVENILDQNVWTQAEAVLPTVLPISRQQLLDATGSDLP